jgi:hypothetical protein
MILSVTWMKVALNGLFIDTWKIGKNVVGRGYGQVEILFHHLPGEV